jgi:hypothetical protein
MKRRRKEGLLPVKKSLELNNHIDIYLLPLAQVPKISRRICFKITPWHAIVPPVGVSDSPMRGPGVY